MPMCEYPKVSFVIISNNIYHIPLSEYSAARFWEKEWT